MKRFIKNVGQWVSALGSWLLKWFLIVLVIGIFVICSAMVGGLIGNRWWIVFAADIAFYVVLWKLLTLCMPRRSGEPYYTWITLLAIALVIMLVLITLATLGVSITTSSRMILNVIIFPIGAFTTFFVFLHRKNRKYVA